MSRSRGGAIPTTISLSREDLHARRQRILAQVGLTEEVLRKRASAYMLQPHERKAFEALRAIEFLLGDK